MSSAEVRAILLHLWLYLRSYLRVFFIFKGHALLETFRQFAGAGSNRCVQRRGCGLTLMCLLGWVLEPMVGL